MLHKTDTFPNHLFSEFLLSLLNLTINLLLGVYDFSVNVGQRSMLKLVDAFRDICLVILIEIRIHQISFKFSFLTSPSHFVIGQSLKVFFICYQILIDKGFSLKEFLIIHLKNIQTFHILLLYK